MTWDAIQAFRDYGGFELLKDFIYLREDGTYYASNTDPRDAANDGTRFWRKEDFTAIDLATADDATLRAMGHLICGAPMHGQWLAELVLNLTHLARGKSA